MQEGCHSSIIHGNMNISRLIVYALQVEEARAKRKSRDAKRARSSDGGSSRGRLDIQDSLGSRRGYLVKFNPRV